MCMSSTSHTMRTGVFPACCAHNYAMRSTKRTPTRAIFFCGCACRAFIPSLTKKNQAQEHCTMQAFRWFLVLFLVVLLTTNTLAQSTTSATQKPTNKPTTGTTTGTPGRTTTSAGAVGAIIVSVLVSLGFVGCVAKDFKDRYDNDQKKAASSGHSTLSV